MIPALSAIIPVQKALSKNLNESLTEQRSSNSGVIKSVVSNQRGQSVLFVTIGFISTFGCSTIYYFLPKALLTLDYSLMLNMFFLILTGLILGLTLLANNLQGILELIIAKVFFFAEKRELRILLGKNLKAH